MEPSDLRIALFSGNYNYVRDGANQALNRLVDYLLRQGASVRVYSPTIEHPAFPAIGDLVSIPSFALPGERSEYRAAFRIPNKVKRDIDAFAPNIIHVSSPDFLGHAAVRYARQKTLPVLASAHTRFETYPRYYGLAFLEPVFLAILRRFYRKCDAVVAPSDSFAQLLRRQRMNYDISIWSRGIDKDVFNPGRRDMGWRREKGISDDEVVIGFLGRIVMEKGLDVFAESIDRLRQRGVRHRIIVVGDGPARGWFKQRLPGAVFTGFQMGADLARSVASMDMLFNPSETEAFGNVTLEAMACSVPVVAAIATGSESILADGVTGRLIRPGAVESFADALQQLVEQHDLRLTMGQAGLLEATKYSWDRINSVVADTYRRIILQREAGFGAANVTLNG
jgi:phosphatidylinositol alpha 1,6-mannosyltransferase